jgi:hypothetical protein
MGKASWSSWCQCAPRLPQVPPTGSCKSAWVWRADQHPNLLILLFMGGQYFNADPHSMVAAALGL